MEDSPAISVSGLSKKYRLYGSVKERLKEALHPFKKQYHREFWALRDISFEVSKGQTLGIIGRNGSGKSTLLAIICSILRPTSGAVEVDGRISALLELGAGFNPQFTGRDNVVFNAQLMGLSAQEIQDRLPKIEAFADIGEFIDQPVKTYSSGMFVRLAFAAAINVDPDILLVDEALAVGDVRFQQKCYRKFMDLQDRGKTIVLVTHDTNAVSRHCDRVILLEEGRIVGNGEPREIVNLYWQLIAGRDADASTSEDATPPHVEELPAEETVEETPEETAEEALAAFLARPIARDLCPKRSHYNPDERRYGDGRGQIVDFFLLAAGRAAPAVIRSGDPVELYVKVHFFQDIARPNCGLKIKTVAGTRVYATDAFLLGLAPAAAHADDTVVYKFSFRLPLEEGGYFVDVGFGEKWGQGEAKPADRRYDLIHLKVQGGEGFEGMVDLGCRLEKIPIPMINTVQTAAAAPISPEQAAGLQAFCLFVGYPRSGHSLVGSLLDACPDVVIAHEFDVLGHVEQGVAREDLLGMLLENSRKFSESGRRWCEYSYQVQGQWQGRFRDLKVIGDKKGETATLRMQANPELLTALRETVNAPVRMIHVVRNPFDNLSTMANKCEWVESMDYAISRYREMCEKNAELQRTSGEDEFIDIRHEQFIANVTTELRRLCEFLGVQADASYLAACADIVFEHPRKSRHEFDWTPQQRKAVEEMIETFPFLHGYRFED